MKARRLRDLPGLGPKSERWLHQVGVADPEALAALGAVRAFVRLCERGDPRPSLNLLYALVGAIEHRPWTDVARTDRERILAQLDGLLELRAAIREPDPAAGDRGGED